jgi:hypothetical protein
MAGLCYMHYKIPHTTLYLFLVLPKTLKNELDESLTNTDFDLTMDVKW